MNHVVHAGYRMRTLYVSMYKPTTDAPYDHASINGCIAGLLGASMYLSGGYGTTPVCDAICRLPTHVRKALVSL